MIFVFPSDVPPILRPEAVKCVLLLLPDEHREALEFLLDFLNQVANNSHFNQMTPSNLGVCLAPSLFHFSHNPNVTNRSNSVSPRRRKTGIPDQRELSENKAAQDCLMYLVKCHRELFMVNKILNSKEREREYCKRNRETKFVNLFLDFDRHIDSMPVQLHGGKHSSGIGRTWIRIE